jgi:hypothetical protein
MVTGLLAVAIVLYLVVPVYAQTISVSNPIYPSRAVLGKDVDVSFTVNWSGVPTDDSILAGVADVSHEYWVNGSMVSSSSNICQANTKHNWADCYILSPGSDGSSTIGFSLDIGQTGLYSYITYAEILYSCSSGVCGYANSESSTFSILVIEQFTLTVGVPSQVQLNLDGVPQSAGSFALQLSPGVHAMSVPDIVQIDSTSRLRFNGWSDGSNQTTRTFDLESDTELAATYVTQYLVTATVDSTLQSGWYDQGTVAEFTVNNTQLGTSYGLLVGGFDGWYKNGQLLSKSPSASITINGPVSLNDKWNYLPYLPPLLIVVIVGVILFFRGNIPPQRLPELKMPRPKRSRIRTRRSKPKVETVTPQPETQVAQTKVKEVKPAKTAKTIMYCNQCGAAISRDSKFCKECGAGQIQ